MTSTAKVNICKFLCLQRSIIWRMADSEPSWPRYSLILLSLLLLLAGFTLFTCSTWLSNIPEHQLHLTLLSPLFNSINITLATFAVLFLICAGVGLIAATRVLRYYTALVSMVARYYTMQANMVTRYYYTLVIMVTRYHQGLLGMSTR